MRNVRNRATTLLSKLCLPLLLCLAILPDYSVAKPKGTKIRSFWVAGVATVTVPADQAIVIMVIRGQGPDMTAALTANRRISGEVSSELEHLGLQGKFRLTDNEFNPGNSAGVFPRSYAFRPALSPGCFEVRRYVLVTFDQSDLSRSDFDDLVAGTLEALSRAGANGPEPSPQMPQLRVTGPVVYTVRDADSVMRKALAQAIAQAKRRAEEVAANEGVKLQGILDARVNRPLEVALPRSDELSLLDELHLHYYSRSKDAVSISATFAAQYSSK